MRERPSEAAIQAEMDRTGFAYMQARSRLIQQAAILRQRRVGSREWRRDNQERIERLANEDWNALASQVDPRLHAKQHLAEMPADKRADLHAEWE